jgi:putative transposase
MTELYKGKYRAGSTRAQWWDYSNNTAYFITICTSNRICNFGKIIDRNMQLSKIGEIANKFWFEIPKHFSFVILDEFVIMPNHIHGILIIDKTFNNQNEIVNTTSVDTRHCLVSETGQCPVSTDIVIYNKILPGQYRFQNQEKQSLSSIIASYKSVVSKNVHRIKPDFKWQSRFYDNIIKNEKSYKNIKNYILNNPLNWKNDKLNK